MRPILSLAVLLAACNFDTSTGNLAIDADPNFVDPNAPDADPNAPDADLTPVPDADPNDPLCGWGYQPAYFNPCTGAGDLPTGLTPLNLNMTGATPPYIFDTDSGILSDPGGTPVVPAVTTSEVGSIRFIWASSVTIANGANLRVEGDKPLAIVSTSDISINGAISVASYFANSDFESGAGTEPAACDVGPSGIGELCEHGGGGGGGGGFGGNGGKGGDGAYDRDCGGSANNPFGDADSYSTGGPGGLLVSVPSTLRGGCAGKDGGDGNGEGAGDGAPGGGAIHLTARGTLTVMGVVHAGGAGGRKSDGSRSGGGGGGSGGMIGLESPQILVTGGGAAVSANGGGGGGGANGTGATDGLDAEAAGLQAAGGAPEDGEGTAGGAGGWAGALDGAPAGPPPIDTTAAKRGGGGGGGGAGFILYYQDTVPTFVGTVSPTPIEVVIGVE